MQALQRSSELTDQIEYVRNEDREEYQRFITHHWKSLGAQMPKTIWHYTDADGLIGILKTGKIYATHISCLNDNLEQKYFGDLVLAEVKKQRPKNTEPELQVLFDVAMNALIDRDFSAVPNFAACFSEAEDDLGQWRGYGGGECGYAIGFRPEEFKEALKSRKAALLLPMNYDGETHDFIVDDVLTMAKEWFKGGIERGLSDHERWANELIAALAQEFDMFASIIKHPKFSGEREHRIVTLLEPGEHDLLEFRQKRTLLARRLPIDLTVEKDGKRSLPITEIWVGPGPAKQVSKISVGDLLMQAGYEGIPVKLSEVPYRLP